VIWLARAVWFYAALASAGCVLLGILFPGIYDALGGNEVEGIVLFATIGFVGATYASAGMLILRQRIRHAVGWILLAAGAFFPSEFLAFALGFRGAQQNDPVGIWLVLVSGALFWPVLLLVGPTVALFFPDGRLPTPRWRWPIRIVAGMVALLILALLVRPGSLDPENERMPPNPIGLEAIPPVLFELLEAMGFVMAILVIGVAIGSIVVRYRRARAEERLQLRWFVFAVVLWCVLLPISLASESIVPATIALGALVLLPISILIAVTRYRLYEIDTLINRTLVYVPLVGIVAGLYAACLALLQRLFVAFTGNTSDGAAVISALILAAVFTPIRKSIEAFVDRRFKPAPPSSVASDAAVLAADPVLVAAVESIVHRIITDRAADPAPAPPIARSAVPHEPEPTAPA
jgi:MFS family permease